MATLSTEEIAHLLDVYSQAEAMLLERIARRLDRGIEQQGWTERKYAETMAMRRELEAALVQAKAGNLQTVDKILGDSFRQGATEAAYQVGSDGVTGQLARTNVPALQALITQTNHSLEAMHAQILRSALDAYRSTIADVTTQLVAGQVTRRQATQNALDKLAGKGITGFVDKAGNNWSMDSYAEMATRTAAARSFLEGKLHTFGEAGVHDFIVSRSGTPCPLCAPWEGRVVSDDGNPMYPSVDQARSEGLFHPNCSHTLDVFTPGTEKLLDVRPNGPSRSELADQRKAYEAGQQQRALERNVRQAKLDRAAAITAEAQRKANQAIAEAQKAVREHVAQTGGVRQYAREQPRSGK